MERLTENTIGRFIYDLKDFKHKIAEFSDYDAFFAYQMAVKRLGEYEDTGLTPEAIERLTAQNEALEKENEEIIYLCEMYTKAGITAEQLSAWLKAEQDGRLVILPCPIGADTWVIRRNMYTNKLTISRDTFEFDDIDFFGKLVFRTREEAAAALERSAGLSHIRGDI